MISEWHSDSAASEDCPLLNPYSREGDSMRILLNVQVWLIGLSLTFFSIEANASPLEVKLPQPKLKGQTSVEEAISSRRPVRDFKREPVNIAELSQILWAAQGITGRGWLRSAPSAGALYPLEIYAVVGSVEGLEAGVYHYDPKKHSITRKIEGDLRQQLSRAALQQEPVNAAPVDIVFTAIYERTRQKYGERATRYVHIEVGHAAQNVYLQADAMGLGTVIIGAFYDDSVKEILGLQEEEPLAIMPVGRK
jgi:SagB-type dehydrogenase family enzyme